MTNSIQIIHALKQQLKLSGIPYRELAKKLDLSESAVKQMFASGNFSLKRLDEVCDVLKMDVTELIDLCSHLEQRVQALTESQEQQLIKNTRLLLVAYCLINHWSVSDILKKYTLSEPEIIRLLSKLDKMKMIELLPGNRVRLLITSNFKWIKNGPIENYFRSQVQDEFFQGNFSSDGALQVIKNGDISDRSKSRLIERLKAMGSLFDDICKEEKKLDPIKRKGTSMILAIRNWEYTVFTKMERITK